MSNFSISGQPLGTVVQEMEANAKIFKHDPDGKILTANGLYNTNGGVGKTDLMTGTPRHLNDVANYTAHFSQAAVAVAEISTVNFTAGENVTAVLFNAWSGDATNFQGFYVTFNSASDADAATRLQSVIGPTTATLRYFIRRDVPRLIKLAAEITRIDLVALDYNDATPDNNIEIEPY